jgi:hypothetical protein
VANAVHGRFQAPVAGDNDHFDIPVELFDILQEIEALPIGKLLVQGNEIDVVFLEEPECVARAVGRLDIEEGAEDDFEGVSGTGFVVDD